MLNRVSVVAWHRHIVHITVCYAPLYLPPTVQAMSFWPSGSSNKQNSALHHQTETAHSWDHFLSLFLKTKHDGVNSFAPVKTRFRNKGNSTHENATNLSFWTWLFRQTKLLLRAIKASKCNQVKSCSRSLYLVSRKVQ